MVRIRVAAVAVCLLSCVPGRDNPNDPAVMPDARLVVSPAEGTRQTPFLLDASASSGSGALSYCWDLDDDPSDYEVPCGPEATLTTSLTIPASALGSIGEGSFEKTVRVVVKSSKSEAAATAAVVVRNTRPHVEPGPEIVTAPETGASVALDGCAHPFGACASFDPDGDPTVTWSWRQVGGTPVVLTTNGILARFTAPLEPQVLFFELEGDDGLAQVRARTSVRVGTTAWVMTGVPARLARIHPEIRSVPAPSVGTAFLNPTASPDGNDLWYDDYSPDIWHADEDGNVLSHFVIPGDAIERIVPRGDAACVLFDVSLTGHEVGFLEPPATGIEGTYSALAIPGVGPGDVTTLLADPDDAEACLVGAGDQGVFRVHADGTSEVVLPPGGGYVGTDSVQTRDGAVWSAYAVTVNGEPRTNIYRFTAAGERLYTAPISGMVEALLPIDDTSVLVIAQNLDYIGRYAFRATPDDFEPVTMPAYPIDVGTRYVPAPDGSFYTWAYAEQVLRRMRLRGNVVEIVGTVGVEELSSVTLLYPAPDPYNGGVVMTQGTSLLRVSSALRPVELVSTMILPDWGPMTVEPVTGSVWVSTYEGAFRVDPSGRAVAHVPYSIGYYTQPRTRALPDGGTALIKYGNSPADPTTLVRSDLFGRETSATAVPGDILAFDYDVNGDVRCAWHDQFPAQIWTADQGVFTSLATDLVFSDGAATPAGACWFATGYSELRYVDGGSTQVFTTTLGSLGPLRADPRDGSLWAFDYSTNLLHHISVTGADLGSIAADRWFDLEQKCAGLGPECLEIWTREGPDLVRKRSDGLEVARYPLPIPASGELSGLEVVP